MSRIRWFGIMLLSASPWAAQLGERFDSVDAFVKSFPNAQADVQQGFDDLQGRGRRDWAGVVVWDDVDEGNVRQLVVLTQDTDGHYIVAALGPQESTNGGSGQHELEDVEVGGGSIKVSWSWHWHGCFGNSHQQIKFYKSQWRVIGAEFYQANAIKTPDGEYDTGDSANLSHNMLTGAAIIDFQPFKGRAIKRKLHGKPSTDVLDENFGEYTGNVEEFSKYAGC